MHQIKMRLDEWGIYHRHQQEQLGYPSAGPIYRAIKFGSQGAAIRSEYREPSMPDAPADIQAVDQALLELCKEHPKAYWVIREGHLNKKRDKWLARHYHTCIRTIQRWRDAGYDYIAERINKDVAF